MKGDVKSNRGGTYRRARINSSPLEPARRIWSRSWGNKAPFAADAAEAFVTAGNGLGPRLREG